MQSSGSTYPTKIGIICPTSHLQDFASLSDFHLILPHLYKEFPAYKEFYEDRIKQGDFVLQDNSVFELEVSPSAEFLIETANNINASEMSTCEVLCDAVKSFQAVEHTLLRSVQLGNKIPLLAVVQGGTFAEFIDYFFKLNSITELSSLGIPFDIDYPVFFDADNYSFIRSKTVRRVFSRWKIVDAIDLEAKKRGVNIKPTHLMGLSDGFELQKYVDIPWIRSNDSSSAFVHGSAGILYTDRGLPCEKIPTKLDFSYSLSTKTQKDAVLYNINKLKEFSGN